MLSFIKSIVVAALVIVAMSLFFALPLWALWPYGARVFGAPTVDYITFAAVLATIGTTWWMVYGGGKMIMAVTTYVVARLPSDD